MANAVSITSEGYLTPVLFPAGMIVILSDPAIPCPYGWVLCNGENGTPDLLGRFPRGVVEGGNCGDVGGAESILLTVDQMPAHTHDGGSYQGSTNAWDHNASGSRHKRTISWGNTSTNTQTRPASSPAQVPIPLLPSHVKVRFIMKTVDPTTTATRPQASSLMMHSLLTGVGGTLQLGSAFPDGITMMWRPPESTFSSDLSSAYTPLLTNWVEDKLMASKIPRGVTLNAADIAASSSGSDSVDISERHYPDHTHELIRSDPFQGTVTTNDSGDAWGDGNSYPGTQCSGFATSKTLVNHGDLVGAPASKAMSILPPYLSVRFLQKKTSVAGGSGTSQQLLVHDAKTSDILGVDFPPGMMALWYTSQRDARITAPDGWRICEEFKGMFPRGFDNSSSSGGSATADVPLVAHSHSYRACYDWPNDVDNGSGRDKLHNTVFTLSKIGGSAKISIMPLYTSLFFIMKL